MQKFTNCIVPDYGNRNSDGYVRVLDKPRSQGGKLKMKHRMEWEKINGPIPLDHEVDHLCKNRECCNVEHLQCIPRSDHRAKDNHLRYKKRREHIRVFKEQNPDMTQKDIANHFGVTQPAVSIALRRND